MAEHDVNDIEGEVRDEELDPEREARRRIALAQIRQYPDAALKLKAHPVAEFDDELASLVERMKLLMHDANGIGLAATQVGVLRRLFVFQPSEDEVLAVVNPELERVSDETEVADEGCLSIQGVTVPVERALEVTLVGRDETGAEVRYELDGYAARCAQHETDHLDGVLMLDRTTPEARREALGVLRPRIVLS
jgi:peptide deformylase